MLINFEALSNRSSIIIHTKLLLSASNFSPELFFQTHNMPFYCYPLPFPFELLFFSHWLEWNYFKIMSYWWWYQSYSQLQYILVANTMEILPKILVGLSSHCFQDKTYPWHRATFSLFLLLLIYLNHQLLWENHGEENSVALISSYYLIHTPYPKSKVYLLDLQVTASFWKSTSGWRPSFDMWCLTLWCYGVPTMKHFCFNTQVFCIHAASQASHLLTF